MRDAGEILSTIHKCLLKIVCVYKRIVAACRKERRCKASTDNFVRSERERMGLADASL